jgi:hypothetical protein
MKEPLQMEALMVLMIYKLAISQPRLITDGPDAAPAEHQASLCCRILRKTGDIWMRCIANNGKWRV